MLIEIADPGVDISLNHTAAFGRTEADVPRRRQVGSLTWLGVLNTHHWIKPASASPPCCSLCRCSPWILAFTMDTRSRLRRVD